MIDSPLIAFDGLLCGELIEVVSDSHILLFYVVMLVKRLSKPSLPFSSDGIYLGGIDFIVS